jgi:hypothetical protein
MQNVFTAGVSASKMRFETILLRQALYHIDVISEDRLPD